MFRNFSPEFFKVQIFMPYLNFSGNFNVAPHTLLTAYTTGGEGGVDTVVYNNVPDNIMHCP